MEEAAGELQKPLVSGAHCARHLEKGHLGPAAQRNVGGEAGLGQQGLLAGEQPVLLVVVDGANKVRGPARRIGVARVGRVQVSQRRNGVQDVEAPPRIFADLIDK